MNLEKDTRVVAADGQVSTTVADEEVILSLDTGTYHGVNGVGARIWQLVQESRSVEDVVAAIEAEYDVDRETAERDVRSFLGDLLDAELLVVDEGAKA